MAAIDALPDRDQGRRAGGRQGRRDRRRRGAGAGRAGGDARGAALRRRPGRRRGVPRRRRAVAARALRRRDRAPAGTRARLQADRRRRRGPNTGGMGAYSPVAGDRRRDCVERIARTSTSRSSTSCARRGTPFHGVLYAGLMLTAAGPRVLEFNVRFGDPETQAVLPRLRSDLLDLMQRATRRAGSAGVALEWDARAAVTVVLASRGYPAVLVLGRRHPRAWTRRREEVEVTHAGTAARGRRRRDRGRAGAQRDGARRDHPCRPRAAYAAADVIRFDGRQLRRDIADMNHERIRQPSDRESRSRPSSRASRSTRRSSASSWAPRATCPPWRPRRRSSTSAGSATRCASCRRTAIPTPSPSTPATPSCAACG